MPTTVDRYFAVNQICQNLATMQNNMRANVQILQSSLLGGGLTFVTAQRAYRDLGNAFQQRLTLNQNVMSAFPSQLSAGATALGISPADVTSIQALLVTWAGNLRNAVITSQADADTLVADVLANVPAAMLPF